MPRHTDNTWLERIAGYLQGLSGTLSGSQNNNAKVVSTGGIYRSAVETFDDGSTVVNHYDNHGNLLASIATAIAGEDLPNDLLKVEHRYTYTAITLAAPTTTLLKTGAGLLHSLDFTAAATGVIKIYDGVDATGTLMRTITSPATLLQNEVNKVYDLAFSVGLTIVTSTAAQDIVVGWR